VPSFVHLLKYSKAGPGKFRGFPVSSTHLLTHRPKHLPKHPPINSFKSVGKRSPSICSFAQITAGNAHLFRGYPTGPSGEELEKTAMNWLNTNKPRELDSKVKHPFRTKGWLIIWTPLYVPTFLAHRARVACGEAASPTTLACRDEGASATCLLREKIARPQPVVGVARYSRLCSARQGQDEQVIIKDREYEEEEVVSGAINAPTTRA
jgi:hypothetical protein